jgi:hypothetical protein
MNSMAALDVSIYRTQACDIINFERIARPLCPILMDENNVLAPAVSIEQLFGPWGQSREAPVLAQYQQLKKRR